MKNEAQNNPQDARIQGLMGQFLRSRALDKDLTHTGESHLDDDSLNAFVEGNLSEREAKPMLAHLVDCSFCRHMTAELVRLDMTFAEADRPAAMVEKREPVKVSEVLSGILSKIFGTGEGAVFAHQESEEEEKSEDPNKELD